MKLSNTLPIATFVAASTISTIANAFPSNDYFDTEFGKNNSAGCPSTVYPYGAPPSPLPGTYQCQTGDKIRSLGVMLPNKELDCSFGHWYDEESQDKGRSVSFGLENLKKTYICN